MYTDSAFIVLFHLGVSNMCVDERGFPWERPARETDIPLLSKHFPGIDLEGAFRAMKVYGFQPLPTDLALIGALFSSTPDKDGVRSVPFSGYDLKKKTIFKLEAMDGIVAWMENTALGTAMWRSVSDWTRKTRGTVIEFTMKCGCIELSAEDLENGNYGKWLERFHASRADIRGVFGQSHLPITDDIQGTDVTFEQFLMWKRMRRTLETLPHEDQVSKVA